MNDPQGDREMPENQAPSAPPPREMGSTTPSRETSSTPPPRRTSSMPPPLRTGSAPRRVGAAAVHERPWAVAVYLSFTAFVGLALAAPLAAVIGSVTQSYPRGDAELFDPGGVMLIEAARHTLRSLSVIGASWAVTAAVALPLSVVVLGFAVALLASRRPPRPAWALARAVRAFPTLVLLGLVALAASAAVAALILMGGGALVRSFGATPQSRENARLGLYAGVVLGLAAVGAIHDLARAAAIAGPSRTYVSMRAAFRTIARAPGAATWAYAWRAIASLAAVAAAVALALRIGERSPGALIATAFLHQLALAATGWLRLSWLAAAVTLVRPALLHPQPDTTPPLENEPNAAAETAPEATAEAAAPPALEAESASAIAGEGSAGAAGEGASAGAGKGSASAAEEGASVVEAGEGSASAVGEGVSAGAGEGSASAAGEGASVVEAGVAGALVGEEGPGATR